MRVLKQLTVDSFYSRKAKAVNSKMFMLNNLDTEFGNFRCNGSEDRPELCSFTKTNNCNSSAQAAVVCSEIYMIICAYL